MIIDVIGSVEGIDAFTYWKSGDLVRCYQCLTTHWQTLKDRATIAPSKCGALVTQWENVWISVFPRPLLYRTILPPSLPKSRPPDINRPWYWIQVIRNLEIQKLFYSEHSPRCSIEELHDQFSFFSDSALVGVAPEPTEGWGFLGNLLSMTKHSTKSSPKLTRYFDLSSEFRDVNPDDEVTGSPEIFLSLN